MAIDRAAVIGKIVKLSTGETAGIGCVVGPGRLITCAHVVNTALDRELARPIKPTEDELIGVEFPLLVSSGVIKMQVSAWSPPSLGKGVGQQDLAELRPVKGQRLPPGTGIASLLPVAPPVRSLVDIFGYPGNPPRTQTGAWGTATVRGSVGGGRMQVDMVADSAIAAQPGFSGSPLFALTGDDDYVVGILAASGRANEYRDHLAITSQSIARFSSAATSSIIVDELRRGKDRYGSGQNIAGDFVAMAGGIPYDKNALNSDEVVVYRGGRRSPNDYNLIGFIMTKRRLRSKIRSDWSYQIELTTQGVRMGDKLFRYNDLAGGWIQDRVEFSHDYRAGPNRYYSSIVNARSETLVEWQDEDSLSTTAVANWALEVVNKVWDKFPRGRI
ncbi:serine protease [Micromonospora sp. NPDC047074]|uniref:serine protease n=1 Tax=Micromonospora sp. NPDC047074 TaxID=3154339 RepID=UPI003409ABE0